ncbi:MAG: MCE family protein [Thermoleophilaceae bacterium]|nr:MCE family protein [Thermoleophilaceae bacterium]
MRRLVAYSLVVLTAVVAVALATGARGGGAPSYRVDAEFDNAGFLIGGQDVKIAGARVGQVKAVKLTPKRRALVEMEIQEGFAPFRADADCIIRPQSLIGEKFVQCSPGTPKAGELRKTDGVPRVPVGQTHAPIDLDLVFASLRLPYRQRLSLIVNELGTGLAGRPEELSETIKRANPALQQVDRVLKIIGRDRRTLGALVEESDAVLAELAGRDGEVKDFIDRAEVAGSAIASRRGDLGTAIDRLPAVLDELEPSARDLASLSEDATPIVRHARLAAPALERLLADFEPLNEAGRPALLKLSDLSRTGRRAVKAARPVGRSLKPVAAKLPPIVTKATELVESLKTSGSTEGLLSFFYYATAATSRFDRFSHILPSYQIAGTCQEYALKPTPGCNANFTGASATASRDARSRGRDEKTRGRSGRTDGPAGPRPTPGPEQPQPPQPKPQAPARPKELLPGVPLPDLPKTGERPALPLLDFLLK